MIGIRNIGKYWARLPTQAELQVIGHEGYHTSVGVGGSCGEIRPWMGLNGLFSGIGDGHVTSRESADRTKIVG